MLDEIKVGQKGRCGWITLQRPRALNALSMNMLQQIHHHLTDFERNPDVLAIVVDSLTPQVFCSGGDIKAIYHHQDDLAYAQKFFALEYHLNNTIGNLAKPYISLIDGICFGGGMGLACHGKYRIMTTQGLMAMPETAIGFYTDVGAGYFLNPLPFALSQYLALTGSKIGLDDSLFLSLATHGLDASKLPDLKHFLMTISSQSLQEFEHALSTWLHDNAYAKQLGLIEQNKHLIHHCFEGDKVEDILDRLVSCAYHLFCRETLSTLMMMSPTSLKVTLAHLQQTQGLSRSEVLEKNLALSLVFCQQDEFYEGIRAMVIDKDKAPSWSPSAVQGVSDQRVQSFFVKDFSLQKFCG